MSKEADKEKCVWILKRYGRFLPKAKETGEKRSWKVFESSETTGKLELTILDSGHLLVSQAQELLEGFSLLSAQSFLKIQQKADSLLFHMTLKGESRMIRLQFEGEGRSEAIDFCSQAVERLQEYLPVGTQEPTAPPPATHIAKTDQQKQASVQTPQAVPDVSEESLSIKHLSQYFLGERGLSLPMAYRHFALPPGDVEDLLRLCLLDCGFPAFVEEVEKKLQGLIQE
ncbi:hypothetical protein NFI96_009957 [Prochilodus magdalenae]|nr:hypothetical protein NFI96_009957 [Prochilodus magdalenae]